LLCLFPCPPVYPCLPTSHPCLFLCPAQQDLLHLHPTHLSEVMLAACA
jgi:hypothetical protein